MKGVKKAIADLELQLTHLQQNIDIPEINLVCNSDVKQVVFDAAAKGAFFIGLHFLAFL